MPQVVKNRQFYKFCLYGFFKNLRLFEPFLLLFLLSKGLDYLLIGTLYSIREILINVFEIPSGVLADQVGRKKTLLIAFTFYILSFLMFYLASGYGAFAAAMALFALGSAFRSGTHKSMIFTYLKLNHWEDQKVDYYGHTRSWSQMGSALSAIFAAIIVFLSGNYELIFILSVIPFILDFFLILSYPSELDIVRSQNLAFWPGLIRTTLNFIQQFKSVSAYRSLLNVSIHSGLYTASKDFMQVMIKAAVAGVPLFLAMTGERRVAVFIGLIYFILYLLSSWSSRNSSKLQNKLQSSSLALNSTMLISIGIMILSGLSLIFDAEYLAVFLFILIFLIENIRKPIGIAAIAEEFDEAIIATTLSVQSQLASLFAAIVAPLIGFIADLYGVGVAFSALGVILLILFPLVRLKSFNI